MPVSTFPSGDLVPIEKCVLNIPNVPRALSGVPVGPLQDTTSGMIVMDNLPEISDTKSAVYNNEPIIGRSFPLYTYHYSSDRTISLQIHFFIRKDGDAETNLGNLRKIQSAAYPREGSFGAPFTPPVICTFECGKMLADGPLCVILQNYSVKFPTDVAYDEVTLCPYRFDVDTSWWVVYTSCKLPNASQIIKSGR